MRTFVLKGGKSDKFWSIELRGDRFTVVAGKVGTRGHTQTNTFDDPQKARAAYDKLVNEKARKGYAETVAAPPAPPTADQLALEAALVAHPDEVAAHSAYADYLIEQGDPRGEFVRVQLALEDPQLPRAERAKLRKREQELQARHEREWLGELGRFLVGQWSGPDKPYHFQFARGWLDYVRTLPFPGTFVAALAGAPEARLLSRLEVVYDMRSHPYGYYEFATALEGIPAFGRRTPSADDAPPTLGPLLTSPYLTNLRAFKWGFSDTEDRLGHSTMVAPFGTCTAKQVIELLAKCPRLEELYLNTDVQHVRTLFAAPALGNLRVLQYYYASDPYGARRDNPYPVTALARNKALAHLTTLRLHPGREASISLDEFDAIIRSKNLPALAHLQVHATWLGADGADRIVASGVLKRLKTLDIAYGNMTDAGARVLAACPDLANLDVLNVSHNALTKKGVSALHKVHARVVADEQHTPDDDSYLFSVDLE